MSKIVVSGYYGSRNAGDEAMLAAMIEVLSELDPKLHITVISADPEDTERRHGVKAIPWLGFGAIWSAIREADLVISGGGSLLQNVTSGRSLYYYLSVIFLARLLRKPVMLYAQGIGPVCGRFPRWLMTTVSQKVSQITVRDYGSLKELESLAVTRPPVEVTADPVLAIHPVDHGLGRAILTKHKAAGAKPVVGISVREWCGWQSYKKVIAAATVQIMREFDARVVFLPMQYPEDVKTNRRVLRAHSYIQSGNIEPLQKRTGFRFDLFLYIGDRIVVSGDDQIFEHRNIALVDANGIDVNRSHLHFSVHGNGNHFAAGRTLGG